MATSQPSLCCLTAAICAILLTLLIDVQRALQLMSSVGLITRLVLLVSGLICVATRVPGARILVLIWLVLLIGGTLLTLRNFALIASDFITVNAMQIGSVMEILLLSLGPGGDEFILLSEGIHNWQEVLGLAERLLQVISLPVALQQQSVRVGASIGIGSSDGIAPDIETPMRQQRKRSGSRGVLYSSWVARPAVATGAR